MPSAPGARAVILSVFLGGQRVVCVGAGPVAAVKALPLLDAGADLLVVAPAAVPVIAEAAEQRRLTWARRPYAPGDLGGALLAVAATSDPSTNARVASDAAAQHVLCVRVDGGGTAAFTATVRRDPLTIAVATNGSAPALAGRVRAELEDRYGPEYATLAQLLGELREDAQVRAALAPLAPDARAAKWRAVLDLDILSLIRTGQPQAAREVALACLCSSSD